MYLWLEILLISTGITARLIIPASTSGSGVNLLVVIFIWLALLVHLLDKSRLSAPAPTLSSVLKLLLGLFATFIVAAFINAPYKFGAFQYLVAWLSDIVLFYLVYSFCVRDRKYITALLSLFLATGLMVMLYGLYQHFLELRGLAEQIQQNPSLLDTIPAELQGATIARAVAGEPFATFIYQNSFGAFLALIIPLLLALAVIRQKRWWIGLIIGLVALFVMVKTGSKGAIVALILGAGLAGGIYYFLKAPSVKKGVLWAGGVIIVIILSGFIIHSQMSDSFNVRLGYWDATVKIIMDNPLNGVGLNQFSNSYLYYKSADAGEVLKAHNDYLQMASEMGIPALLVFLAIWFIILKSIFRPFRVIAATDCHSDGANGARRISPYILGSAFAFLISEIFQTPLIAIDIPFLSTIIIFILWVMVFRFLSGYLSKCHCEESGTTKQSLDSEIATPLRARNDNKMMGLLRIGLFAGLLAFLIHCTVDFNLYVQGLSMSVWFIGAVFLSTGASGKVVPQTHTKSSKILVWILLTIAIWGSIFLSVFTIRLIQYESFLEQGKMMFRSKVSEERMSAFKYIIESFIYNPFSVDASLELAWVCHSMGDAESTFTVIPLCLTHIDRAISLNPLAPMLYNQQGRLYLEHAEQERQAGHDKMARIYEQRAKRAFQMVKELYPTYKDNKK